MVARPAHGSGLYAYGKGAVATLSFETPFMCMVRREKNDNKTCGTLRGFPIDSESRSIVSYATSSSLSTSSWYLSPSLCSYILTYIVVWWVQYVPRVILVSRRPRSHEAFNFLGFSYPFNSLIQSALFTSISFWEVVWGDEVGWFFGFLSILEHSLAYLCFVSCFSCISI